MLVRIFQQLVQKLFNPKQKIGIINATLTIAVYAKTFPSTRQADY